MEKKLIVSEVFYSIQGEGQTMGIPSVFIRLGGCNLMCKSKDWICDSIEVWQKSKAVNFADVLPEEYLERLKNGAHLIITGGEPLLHQHTLLSYLGWLRVIVGFSPVTEIETNGTIEPIAELFPWIRYWNVSPKLSNSGESYERRVNEVAIHKICSNVAKDRLMFKFVINKPEDLIEIFDAYTIPAKCVFLMPAGATQEELLETRPMVAEQCKQFGFRYSERLHIGIWNKKTGV